MAPQGPLVGQEGCLGPSAGEKPSVSIRSLYFRKVLLLVKYLTCQDRKDAFTLPKCGLLFRGTHPLSRTTALKLVLELLAGGSLVVVLIQTFPQLVSGVPTRFSLGGVWSCHRCVGEGSNVVSDATLTRSGFISHLSRNFTRCPRVARKHSPQVQDSPEI